MKNMLLTATVGAVMVVVQGCTQRVLVPPRIDLKAHEVVGVLDFDCDGGEEFGPVLMDRFVEAVRCDQGMVRVLRLGSASEVLGTRNPSELDPAACKALGERFNVKTIFTGRLTVSDVKPNFSVTNALRSLHFSAEVDAALAVQMLEAESGASLWSASARNRRQIGGVSVFGDKSVAVHADDPENAYGALVDSLVYAVTPDFRPTWIRVRKSK